MSLISWQRDTQAPRQNNTEDALKEYWANLRNQPLDYTMLLWLCNIFSSFENQRIYCIIFHFRPYIRNIIAQTNKLHNHIERLGTP